MNKILNKFFKKGLDIKLSFFIFLISFFFLTKNTIFYVLNFLIILHSIRLLLILKNLILIETKNSKIKSFSNKYFNPITYFFIVTNPNTIFIMIYSTILYEDNVKYFIVPIIIIFTLSLLWHFMDKPIIGNTAKIIFLILIIVIIVALLGPYVPFIAYIGSKLLALLFFYM